jgi:hypothetical protein
MRETRRFIVDTIAHHPELKLEWLSIGDGDRAQRILRKPDIPKRPKYPKGKGKMTSPSANYNASGFPILPFDGWDDASESDGDEEGEDSAAPFLKLDLVEDIAFYDIWGIRIFKKEIMAGTL